MLELVFCW